jgi:2-C-methyl-D-erythritol 2,4-cyclodiphosphate synthase
MSSLRVGNGLDVHRFSEDPDRPLVLAGTVVPGAPGLAGHSDADVVAHALCDALLGACGLGDLGSVFGVAEPERAGADSLGLLAEVLDLVERSGWRPHNVDCTVVASRPRLAEHRPAMRSRLSEALGLGGDAVSVKITSSDGLGAVGRGEGIACWATVTVVRIERDDDVATTRVT